MPYKVVPRCRYGDHGEMKPARDLVTGEIGLYVALRGHNQQLDEAATRRKRHRSCESTM